MNALISKHFKTAAGWKALCSSWRTGNMNSTAGPSENAADIDHKDGSDGQADSETTNQPTVLDMDIIHQQDSRILNLPAELRIKIYEYCLIEKDLITVSKDLRSPALLSTCRLIRKEAVEIWYLSNRFRTEIDYCDATLLNTFYKGAEKHGASIGERVDCGFTFVRKDWRNLMKWCRQIWVAECFAVARHEDFSNAETVIYAAHTIAIESQALPWEACERQLMALRMVAGRMDPKWLR